MALYGDGKSFYCCDCRKDYDVELSEYTYRYITKQKTKKTQQI